MITLNGAKALIQAVQSHRIHNHRIVLALELDGNQTPLLANLLTHLYAILNSADTRGGCVYIGSQSAESLAFTLPLLTKAPGSAKQLLGQESAMAIVDWRVSDRLNYRADDLGAIGGLVVAGGVCVLLLDKDASQSSAFLRRLYQRSEQHAVYTLVLTEALTEALPALSAKNATKSAHPLHAQQINYTPDQQTATAALIKAVTGHRRRPLVLTANRGRGKSTALGLACAELLKLGKSHIAVTAHRPQALDAVFEHALKALPESHYQNRTIQWQQGEIRFIPLDQLLDETAELELDALFVDEAAAISAPQLQQLLERYGRVAFSSTIHGYEGTGRGFSLRFLPYLAKHYPQYHTYELTEPLRWAKGDPLEAWLFDTLLLDAEPVDYLSEGFQLTDLNYRFLSGVNLVTEEALLRQAFGLLVQAHYQTSPDDLARLLDDPAFSLLVASQSDTVLGVIMLAKETLADKDVALKQQIAKGERRPKGNLLLQQLVSQYGDAAVLDWQGYRVVRIAVIDELRRSGLGTALLNTLKAHACEQVCDFIGSSFAATQDVIAFWQQNGYQTVQLGSKRDGASGCYSASVIKPLTQKAIDTTAQYQAYFTYQALNIIPALWPKLAPELAQTLFYEEQSKPEALNIIEQQDQTTLKRFSQGECSYEVAIPALRRMLEQAQSDKALFDLVYQRLILGLSWQQCGFDGRKQGVNALRGLVAGVL